MPVLHTFLSLTVSMLLLLQAVAAPVPPRNASSYTGNRIQDLTLQLRPSSTKYNPKYGDESPRIELTLTNHSGKACSIEHLQTVKDRLEASRGLRIVIRFKSGAIFRVGYGLGPIAGHLEQIPFRPFALPAGASVSREQNLLAYLSHDARLEFDKCKDFCVTAVLPGLKLKSNTVFFNDFFDLGPEYDPFKDSAEYDRRQKEESKRDREEQEARTKEREEREEKERQRRKEQERKKR